MFLITYPYKLLLLFIMLRVYYMNYYILYLFILHARHATIAASVATRKRRRTDGAMYAYVQEPRVCL